MRPSLTRLFSQQRVHLSHDLERIRHVEHVGFPPRPAAVGIQIHRPAFVDEPPPDGVRFLSMAAGGQALGVPRGVDPVWPTWPGRK